MRCSLGSDLLSLSVLLLLLRALSLLFADNGPVPFLHLVLSAIVVAIAVCGSQKECCSLLAEY